LYERNIRSDLNDQYHCRLRPKKERRAPTLSKKERLKNIGIRIRATKKAGERVQVNSTPKKPRAPSSLQLGPKNRSKKAERINKKHPEVSSKYREKATDRIAQEKHYSSRP
jgi:hypothetical protein